MLTSYALYCYLIPLFGIIFIPGLIISYILKILGLNKSANRTINFLAYAWMKVFLWTTGRKLEFIPGELNLDDKKRFIICNHTNSLEVPFVVAIPFLAKKIDSMLSYLGGDIIDRYWIIPLMMHARIVEAVKYSDKNPNFRNFKSDVMRTLRDKSIFLFPEGRRTYTEEIQPMKTGVLKLAYKFKIDLDVFVISGMMGYSSDEKYSAMRKSKKIYFKYCGSLRAEDFKDFDSMREATENLMKVNKSQLDEKFFK
ncbi:lysophospholipid acyltransferase family protein [Leptospira sp. GIMC2001]|uniref:lysophospholipid acyltransferase family protein n=1 Tax=Leptospira sp. GIMC2001 TaxID=1513297 RepID=UPI002349A0B6|nr:lysophospholipid acyltransferase family protein [Leptospira sp. GIMC2001]WCL50070.1 lysophospholipid acyltransferase family protein [Leptospira sp. GIMC2001]